MLWFKTAFAVSFVAVSAVAAAEEKGDAPERSLRSGQALKGSGRIHANAQASRKLQQCDTSHSTIYDDQDCMATVNGKNKEAACTSGDVQIESITLLSVDGVPYENEPLTCNKGDTISIDFEALLATQSADPRHDVGIFIQTTDTSKSAQLGTKECAVVKFNAGADGGLPDLEEQEGAESDACGDIQRESDNGGVAYTPQICGLTIQCEDPDETGTVKFPYCIAYRVGGASNEVCDDLLGRDPAEALTYSSVSKCTCSLQELDIKVIECSFSAACNEPPPVIVEGCDSTDVPAASEDPSDFFNDITTNPCGSLTLSHADTESGSVCPGVYTVDRVYTLADEEGNSATCAHKITVQDTTAPVPPSAPASVTTECELPTPVSLTATDNCGAVITPSFKETVFSESSLSGCKDKVVEYQWTYDDGCNSAMTTQQITVKDTRAPVPPTAPGDYSDQCVVPTAPTPVNANDNCDGVLSVAPVFSDMVTDTSPADYPDCNNQIIQRTWTYTDACGNADDIRQTVVVSDTMQPQLTCPDNIIGVSCNDAIPAGEDITAIDTCDGNITVTPTCCWGSSIKRTYTAVDKCGLSASCTQEITQGGDTC